MKKIFRAVEKGPESMGTVQSPIFAEVEFLKENDAVAHLRALKKAYNANEFYFKGFKRMPLGRLRVETTKFVPAKHVIKLSFVKGNLRVNFWQESGEKVQTIMRKHKFWKTFRNLLARSF